MPALVVISGHLDVFGELNIPLWNLFDLPVVWFVQLDPRCLCP